MLLSLILIRILILTIRNITIHPTERPLIGSDLPSTAARQWTGLQPRGNGRVGSWAPTLRPVLRPLVYSSGNGRVHSSANARLQRRQRTGPFVRSARRVHSSVGAFVRPSQRPLVGCSDPVRPFNRPLDSRRGADATLDRDGLRHWLPLEIIGGKH